MFKIGEFSKLTQISVRMLRYYDQEGLLKPNHIDTHSGYRYYGVDQIDVCQKLKLLRDMNFSIDKTKALLAAWNKDLLRDEISHKQQDIRNQINELQRKLQHMDAALIGIQKDQLFVHYNITLRSVPAMRILSLRDKIPTYFHEADLWQRLHELLQESDIPLDEPAAGITLFHDEEHMECDVDVEVAVATSLTEIKHSKLQIYELEEVPLMACIMVYGAYDRIDDSYRCFASWIAEHNLYKIYGPTRQIAHRGAWNEENRDNWLTEIQVPISMIR